MALKESRKLTNGKCGNTGLNFTWVFMLTLQYNKYIVTVSKYVYKQFWLVSIKGKLVVRYMIGFRLKF